MNKNAVLPLLCVLLSLTLALGLFFPENRQADAAKTVLLNPKNLPNVAKIELEQGGTSLVLFKDGSRWKGLSGGAEFIADSSLPGALLEELAAARTVYMVREKPPSYESYGLDGQSALHMRIRGANGELYADLLFGHENFSALELFFRNAKTPRVYQTASARLSRFLHIEADKWADMRLFPPPEDSAANILRVRIRSAAGELVLNNTVAGAAEFDKYGRFLFEVRGSAVHAAVFSTPPAVSIRVEYAAGRDGVLNIYEEGTGEAERFFAVNETAGGKYALEISKWTLDRLLHP